MKLLVLTPQLPFPPRQGTTIRNYNLIRYLARHHQIVLFTFLANGEQLSANSPLHNLCQRIETVPQPERSTLLRARQALTTFLPDMALRLDSQEAHERVSQLVEAEKIGAIQVEGIEMAAYGWTAQAAAQANGCTLPLLFDDHNAEYLLQKRTALVDLGHPKRWIAAGYSLLQWIKLARYERLIAQRADAVAVVSEPDRQALRAIAPSVQPQVVPNGIDLDAYPPVPKDAQKPPATLVFTGKMDYRPNVDAVLWFADKVLPIILQTVPEARFQIVGMNPHKRLDRLRHTPAITITGAVEDIVPYIQAAGVYVVPMRVGGGTRFKVLEAMSCAKEIVTTSLGVEGIPIVHGREVLIGNEPETFAAHCIQILTHSPDPQAPEQDYGEQGYGERGYGKREYGQMGKAARQFVQTYYSWEKIVPIMEQALDDMKSGQV